MAIPQQRLSFLDFVRENWHRVSEDQFQEIEEARALCMALDILPWLPEKRLFSSQIPGSGKSLITAVLWPVWVWLYGDLGAARFLVLSHAEVLSGRSADRVWGLLADLGVGSLRSPTRSLVEIEFGGRWIGSTLWRTLGYQCDFLILDDAVDPRSLSSQAERRRYKEAFRSGALCRIVPNGGLVVVESSPGMIDLLTEREQNGAPATAA